MKQYNGISVVLLRMTFNYEDHVKMPVREQCMSAELRVLKNLWDSDNIS